MKKILIVSKTDYFMKKIKKKNFFFFQKKKNLNLKYLSMLNPSIIFFPHSMFRVSEDIINKYLCIGFHATPLPYGRGGTPVQNMILRGFSKTKLCAIKLEKKYDTGSIYKMTSVSLNGSGSEIFQRLYLSILKIIRDLSTKLPKPKKQIGKPTYFKRRNQKDSKIKENFKLIELYNFIRMLDMDEKNFPKAYLEIGKFKYEFLDAKKFPNFIKANVVIKKIN